MIQDSQQCARWNTLLQEKDTKSGKREENNRESYKGFPSVMYQLEQITTNKRLPKLKKQQGIKKIRDTGFRRDELGGTHYQNKIE